ncbi:hypothetical protein CYMTET_51609 [Cymbomonas tetramitiformis]|uniref:Pre-mRNA-splicing factor SPF27 n=1 Tax=Cymbomonas tetramitiformis TaxID=36881 RepID=A0AAE0ERN0_9CHLO|nr:hypothetical protein CYMTET_51609 [Cymbomonas tetramitiformis]
MGHEKLGRWILQENMDHLPYVDELPEGWQKGVNQLIQEEMRRSSKTVADYLSDLPPLPPQRFKEGSMIADEMDRVAANQKLTAIDTARYALQQPPLNRRNDVGAWKQAVNNARAQLEHQALRLTNLELLAKFGANAWRVHLQHLEATVKGQEDQQASYQKEIESVNSERKLKQVSVGNSLRECEEEWQGLVSKNMQIDLACQELEKEIDQLKASQVGASEGPSDAAQGAESADSVMDEA